MEEEPIPSPEQAAGYCRTCYAEVREDALFCGQCGSPLTGDDPPRPPAPRLRRARLYPTDERLWRQFKPCLWLWIILLASNGVLGGLGNLLDIGSPWFDVGFTLFDAAVIVAFCLRDKGRLAPFLVRSGLTRRTWYLPLVGFVGLFVFMWAYIAIVEFVGGSVFAYLDDFNAHNWPLWTAFVLIAVCPAVFEEFAFRGFIMSRLDAVMKPADALLVQAALFSVLHMLPLIFVSHFVIGVVLGFLRRRTGSLYPGILLHMAWNAWVLIEEIAAT